MVGQQNADNADTLQLRDVAMATTFWLSVLLQGATVRLGTDALTANILVYSFLERKIMTLLILFSSPSSLHHLISLA